VFEVHEVLEHLRAGGEIPIFRAYEEREACDPHALARKIIDERLDARAKLQLLAERYTPLAQAIYPSKRGFAAAVEDATQEILEPDSATQRIRAKPVFGDWPDKPLREGPHHDLGPLLRETLAQGQQILALPMPLPNKLEVCWTRRFVKGWFAQVNFSGEPGTGRIRINRLLDSPDVEPEVLRFLLWHEYLHAYLQQGHTKTFRELERRWPSCRTSDRFLDTLNEKFDVPQYW